MANDLIPYKRPGEDVTAYVTAAVIGKRCVQISAAKVNKAEGLSTTGEGGAYRVALPSGAGANGGAAKMIFGVAKYDQPTIGKFVGVVREGIVPITASAAITAGVSVQVAADGTVVPVSTGVAIGIACDDCANGADCEVALLIS
ncbi:MAG TPA: capsid cement protein [bacterium]|nr:capsid cement protein [bacterium]